MCEYSISKVRSLETFLEWWPTVLRSLQQKCRDTPAPPIRQAASAAAFQLDSDRTTDDETRTNRQDRNNSTRVRAPAARQELSSSEDESEE